LNIRLIEGVNTDCRSGRRHSKLPAEKFLAEIVFVL
jgi:hypothetical protein